MRDKESGASAAFFAGGSASDGHADSERDRLEVAVAFATRSVDADESRHIAAKRRAGPDVEQDVIAVGTKSRQSESHAACRF